MSELIKPMTIMQGQKNIRMVLIPEEAHSSRKGSTKYDVHLEKLLAFSEAMQIPESEFQSVRKALTRFLRFRKLDKAVSVRQKKDHRTKTYLLWIVNQPPQGNSND